MAALLNCAEPVRALVASIADTIIAFILVVFIAIICYLVSFQISKTQSYGFFI